MVQLIKADLYRIFNKKTMYVYVGFCAVAFVGLMLLMNANGMDAKSYPTFVSVITNFMGLFVGTFVVALVYNDDLKSKSLQSAIGFGMKRSTLVFTKFGLALIMFAIMVLGYSALVAIMPQVMGYTLEAQTVTIIAGNIMIEVVKIIAYIGLVSVVAFAIQKPTFVTTIFILLATGTFGSLLGLILGQGFMIKIFGNLMQYTPTVMGNTYMINLSENVQRFDAIGAILIYALVGLVVSAILFKNKELEF